MRHTEQRQRLRAIFAGNQCFSPATVYDALSARVAESVGFQIGMLAGSVASNTTLAAPGPSPIGRIVCSLHSKATGASATRGGRTRVAAADPMPNASNSLSP